jgi:hypothetical protein
MTNWSLPSAEELDLLLASPYRADVGGFTSTFYWSSSQDDKRFAYDENFTSHKYAKPGKVPWVYSGKDENLGVRPIRAW